jgi:UDP-N-acetylglucosamine--N-acetylmuramyl-(pentapeptide) pyrophosphoryl-undecaprenol N-acetylglucosamine transferase
MIASDLVICRSGASTLSELASCSKPSVLIPSPNVTNNQQFHNAKEYSDLGAAVMIEDADLSPMSLEKTVKALLDNEKELEEIGARASEFEVKNSERILFEKIKAIAQNKKA